MMGCPSFLFLQLTKESQTCERVNMKYVQQISPFCFARKSPMGPLAFSHVKQTNQKKKQYEHLCITAISLVAAYEMFEHTAVHICLLYVQIYIRDVYIICFHVLR
jgi:hypothetical protein